MKKIISLLLVITITALMLIPVYADLSDEKSYVEAAEVSGSWTYTVNNNEATITAYSGTETEIEIPSELDGYTVTAIQSTGSRSAFSNASTLKSVVIPDNIKSIGSRTFSACSSLESVTLPSGLVSIGDYAFYRCLVLNKISFPSTLEVIGDCAFTNCKSLTEISFPENLTTIGERAFYGLELITSLTIPASVNSIGEAAFVCRNLNEISVAEGNNAYCAYGNALYSADMTKMLIYAAGNKAEEFEIPAGVTEVGAYTFYYCDSLKNIRIPSSVSSIDSTNFYTCANLENIYVDEASESFTDIDGILYDKAVTKLISRPSNNAAVDLVIPDTVTTVGDYALIDISNVVTITIPASVTLISSLALMPSKHENITNIYYGGSKDSWDKLWKSIGGSYYTTADVFPNAEIHYDNTILSDWTYTKSGSNATITGYSGDDTVVTIPSEIDGLPVTSIQGESTSGGKSIFSSPAKITEIIIPEGITSIGAYAFARCTALTSVTIPESVTSIGQYAFYNCVVLKEINLPSALKTIGNSAFAGCRTVTSLTIPNGVISIGDKAFDTCISLAAISEIPSSVSSIGQSAFYALNLSAITVSADSEYYRADGGVLFNKDKTELLIYPSKKTDNEYAVPETVKTIYASAFNRCENLVTVTIPASVTNIGSGNFIRSMKLESISVSAENADYTDLDGVLYSKSLGTIVIYPSNNSQSEITIPSTVTKISSYAFYYTQNLKSLTIPISVKSVDGYSFHECNGLTDIYYEGSQAQWNSLLFRLEVYNNAINSATIHYNFGTAPTQTPASTQTPAPTPGPTHTPGPTAAPVKWRINGFNEEDGRINIVVGKGTAKGTPFTVIAAKYKDDDLIDAVIDNSVTDVEGGIGQSVFLSRKLVTNEGEYVKIMLWDGTASCKPLCEPYIGNVKVAAFPGAEGAGKYSTGAREAFRTEVCHVTNLNDSGEGSFRDAVSKQGRIVVFDVGGTINLTKRVDIASAITILGQTAPGDGITITGANVVASGGSQIIRYLRIRPTDVNGLEADAFGGSAVNSIIDHCSTSYSVDECLTFYSCANTTVQNCISSESLKASIHGKGNHGYGGIWGGTNSSYHHNLMATHDSRTPRLDRQLQGTDVRNNIIYNWGNTNSAYGGESVSTDGSYFGSDTKVNWVNNYYKTGAATASKLRTRLFDTSSPKEYPSYFYFSGNVLEGNAEVTADNTKGVRINSDKGMVFLDEPVEMKIDIPEESAEETYSTLLSHVGASLPRRDETDARVINDVINGTGRIIDSASEVGGVMQYEPTHRVFEIPQEWKDKSGMGDSTDTDIVPFGKWMGYTWIEAYVNEWTEQQENPTNPTVTVKADKTSAAVQGTVSVSASAAPQSGTEIVKIDIYDNDVLVSTHNGANVAANIQLGTVGTHYISAVAYNNKGEGTRSTPIAVTATALE